MTVEFCRVSGEREGLNAVKKKKKKKKGAVRSEQSTEPLGNLAWTTIPLEGDVVLGMGNFISSPVKLTFPKTETPFFQIY